MTSEEEREILDLVDSFLGREPQRPVVVRTKYPRKYCVESIFHTFDQQTRRCVVCRGRESDLYFDGDMMTAPGGDQASMLTPEMYERQFGPGRPI